jgi:ABC-type dipeptide/oligopeptide/nickel transport system permease subunit
MTTSTTTLRPAAPLGQFEITRKPRSLFSDALHRLVRNKASMAGLVIIVIFMLMAIFAPVLAPRNPLEITSGAQYLPPAWEKGGDPRFLLGTDTLGRDVLSRTIWGARTSMVVGFVPAFIIVIIGTMIGMVAGFAGGRADNLLMRLTDVFYAFPDLLFFIIVMVSLRDTSIGQFMNGLLLLFVALAIIDWVGVARLMRGQVLSLKEKEFIEAGRMIGAPSSRIMMKHLLPNSLGVLIVRTAFLIPGLIITEAILGYLGIGLRPATSSASTFITSWGALMLEGQTAIRAQITILLAPALCVALVVMAFTFLGDGLRDALDPRMAGMK